MSTSSKRNTGLTLAMLGGGAFLIWLLWRGKSKGRGEPDRGSESTAVVVQLRAGDALELDGVASDLSSAVARARVAGKAHVFVTGDTRHGWITQVVDALTAAGVVVDVAPPPRYAPGAGEVSSTLASRNARPPRLAARRAPVEAHTHHRPRHRA